MVTFDKADVDRRLETLEFPRAVAFAAACAQRRRAVGVRILEAHARAEDAAVFDLALEHLWSTAATQAAATPVTPATPAQGDPESGADAVPEAAIAAWERLDGFPEFDGDEENTGDLAYAEDAITTLWYATQFARGLGADNAVYCASRSYDAAGFLDGQSPATADGGASSDLADTEARGQLEDLAELATDEPLAAVVGRVRVRAEGEGERAAVAVPGPGTPG